MNVFYPTLHLLGWQIQLDFTNPMSCQNTANIYSYICCLVNILESIIKAGKVILHFYYKIQDYLHISWYNSKATVFYKSMQSIFLFDKSLIWHEIPEWLTCCYNLTITIKLYFKIWHKGEITSVLIIRTVYIIQGNCNYLNLIFCFSLASFLHAIKG